MSQQEEYERIKEKTNIEPDHAALLRAYNEIKTDFLSKPPAIKQKIIYLDRAHLLPEWRPNASYNDSRTSSATNYPHLGQLVKDLYQGTSSSTMKEYTPATTSSSKRYASLGYNPERTSYS